MFGRIVADRRAALLYHGLAALDDPTLEFLDATPDLLARLHLEHAPAFATLGRSLHVREGAVRVPGGPEAERLWEELVGAETTRPERFLDLLLARDGGRLALLYDTIEHLDASHARFALGSWTGTLETQETRLARLYHVFASSSPEWSLRARPFRRPSRGPSLLLRQMAADDTGRPLGPAWQRLWEAAFDGDDLPEQPERELAALDPDRLVDAAWLAERVFLARVGARRDRLDAFLFAQRTFGDATAEAAPDLLVSLRTFGPYRALTLTLERIGVTDPATFADAVRHAAILGTIGARRRARASLAQFQACLAIVDRARTRRSLDHTTATALVRSLVGLRPREDGSYGRRISRWIATELRPALQRPSAPSPQPDTLESRVLATLAGSPRVTPVALVWEGLDFRVDPASAERQRLGAIRERQRGTSLDTALALCDEAVLLAAARSLEEATTHRDRLAAIVGELPERPGPAADRRGPPAIREIVERALRQLQLIRTDADLGRLEEIARPLAWRAEALLSEVLTAIVYAAHLGDPEGLLLLAGDVARRHDFGLGISNRRARRRRPWRMPGELSGGSVAWHVSGSLLGLDIGLARLVLRRTGMGMPPRPTLNEGERRTFIQGVALLNPFDLTDADRDQITAAIARGRHRVEALSGDASEIARLAEQIGLSEWRRRALTLSQGRAPDLVRAFSLADLFWLGHDDGARATTALDAWGTARLAWSGCYCTTFPSPEPWEEFTGRLGTGLLSTRVVDLTLRVAEVTRELGLPAMLVPGILTAATLDFVDEVQPRHHDDWWALIRQAGALSRQRVEDYVASLVAGGPLVSVSGRGDTR